VEKQQRKLVTVGLCARHLIVLCLKILKLDNP
jgi:hypothetical protein